MAPSQDDLPDTPLIVPSSPTAAESQRGELVFLHCSAHGEQPADSGSPWSVLTGPDEPMDTSLSPEDQAIERDDSKPLPTVSTPVSQNSPSFVLDGMLSVPSQPEFSHVCILPISTSRLVAARLTFNL